MRVTSKLSLLVLLIASFCHLSPTLAQTEDPLFASIRKAGGVKVAVVSLPPYMIMSPNGEATGASIDLQNMVLKGMGLPALTPVVTDWAAMIPSLQARHVDYVGAGWDITAETCKVVIFSTPYYALQAALYVLPGNPKHLTTVADVARGPALKVAIIGRSSDYRRYALSQGVKPEQILDVPDHEAAVASVRGGRVDAFLVGQFGISDPEQKGVEEVVDERSPITAGGAVFRKEDARFRDAFNEQLNLLIKKGAIQKLYEKYGIANGDARVRLLGKYTKASDFLPSCE
ncbi:transporter substrate-binding domain-containing protein [Bradyrhizobium vignae]|uniref:Putative ABC transporter, substrate binding protein (Amino acid) n=1 Tax=Bradyrhizobium vignae TaxID=1549949 RepID=A0A2U3Q9P3_9BRAD|nr:transporter substrate-binding domain-containing protein [Bradyrhizobium vignae]SPP98135.1 putative ABC transporter, substrate binding protein (Amino acid) [Bradyrhizobium vignae]